ncbi:hypothetical protein [Candidatus Neptunochlamydia vexilliferae]|uniref:DUF349 domain-containing protein n=1 Tax=Candidatus Neptunichlamydia vexilliferae TaxID=1651774 RepID=A0ABS0AYJ1_9BACT|nr:hypothetical protein [Candidatus Neptunochlamydia vexilliferae]MBF5059186.1 hypothetical protein [Candidatus Neptunochlamydia vexilliferae]
METENKEKKPKVESEIFKTFRESFEGQKEIEEKIRVALDFMEEILGKPNGVSLKEFWDAKKLCGPLFKEEMNPIKRNHLWNEYAEMGDEARRLKEIKDEQAAFSVEQVELAIEALEADVDHYDRLVANSDPIHFPKGAEELQIKLGEYEKIQKELSLLKTLISRLDALRKEVLAIDMRISHKNKILKRLSKLGDHVFPKRKELIKKVSDQFAGDVESFAKDRFSGGKTPYYVIRNEIKLFQAVAKVLTLNSQAFTKARKVLSECWDKIKEKETERRAQMGERSEEWKKNYEEIAPKVAEFEAFCEKPENQDRTKVLDASNALQEAMRGVSLSRENVKELKEWIQKARNAVLDKLKEQVEEKKAASRKKVEDIKDKLTHLIEKEETTSLEDLEKGETELKEAYRALSLNGMEIHVFERNFADLKSFILDKREGTVGTDHLQELYEERAAHIEVIKSQVKEYRKEMGGSGLDFEKGMTYRELYDSAKIHLDKEVEALENLEEKLV